MIINYSDQKVLKGKKSIFLAGPTPRDKNTISWRPNSCNILRDYGFDGIVYVPEYSSFKPKESYTDQALWEHEALMSATVIAFWIPRCIPSMMGLTTNVEFGYYLHTGKVLYGRPDNAEKIKYLDWIYEFDYNKKPFNTLEDLLKNAIIKADEMYKI